MWKATTCFNGPTFSMMSTRRKRCSAMRCAIRSACLPTARWCHAVWTTTATCRSAISTTTASTRFSPLHAPLPSTTVSPATPPWNRYAGAADIPPFPNGSENRNRNGRQEVVSFQFRFGNHDEGTSLKFLILGLAMSISFRYHWSLPLRSPSI